MCLLLCKQACVILYFFFIYLLLCKIRQHGLFQNTSPKNCEPHQIQDVQKPFSPKSAQAPAMSNTKLCKNCLALIDYPWLSCLILSYAKNCLALTDYPWLSCQILGYAKNCLALNDYPWLSCQILSYAKNC